jgi:hypothetical protein
VTAGMPPIATPTDEAMSVRGCLPSATSAGNRERRGGRDLSGTMTKENAQRTFTVAACAALAVAGALGAFYLPILLH